MAVTRSSSQQQTWDNSTESTPRIDTGRHNNTKNIYLNKTASYSLRNKARRTREMAITRSSSLEQTWDNFTESIPRIDTERHNNTKNIYLNQTSSYSLRNKAHRTREMAITRSSSLEQTWDNSTESIPRIDTERHNNAKNIYLNQTESYSLIQQDTACTVYQLLDSTHSYSVPLVICSKSNPKS